MLPRKYVTATAVTIAGFGQAGARISPKGAQPLQPKTATHVPPPCAPKLADHHPLPKSTLHHQAEHPHAAQSHHRDNPSRSPQCSIEALATGQSEPSSSRSIAINLTADRSRRSGAREPQWSEDRRAPPCTHEEDEQPLPNAQPVKPRSGPLGPSSRHAAVAQPTSHLPRRAPLEQPPRRAPPPPTWGRRH
jgi:hypothetical protein